VDPMATVAALTPITAASKSKMTISMPTTGRGVTLSRGGASRS
jgi:hypothetical protein